MAPGVGFLKNTDDRLNTDANSIHFTRDIDNKDGDEFLEPDGEIDGPNEDIVYYRRNAAGNVLNAGDNTVGTLVGRVNRRWGFNQPDYSTTSWICNSSIMMPMPM